MERIEEDVEGDFLGVVPVVAGAFERVLLLECTGEVVGRKDHGPAVTDPNALELGGDPPAPGGERAVAAGWLAERHLADVEAAVVIRGEQRIGGGDFLEFVVGQHGGDLFAEGRGETPRRADAIGEERAAPLEELS